MGGGGELQQLSWECQVAPYKTSHLVPEWYINSLYCEWDILNSYSPHENSLEIEFPINLWAAITYIMTRR